MPAKQTLADRAQRVTRIKNEFAYESVDIPGSTANYVESYRKASAPRTGNANEHYIYVLPDFAPILMFIAYNAIMLTPALDERNHPKVSTASFIAYCLALVYTHFLVSDAYINPHQGHFSAEIVNDSIYENFLQFMLSLPVPNFLVPIITNFTSTTTARRINIWFLASTEGFMHYFHFGRFFPINLFLNMHDIAATTNSRDHPGSIRYDLNMSEIFSITNYFEPNSDTIAPRIYRFNNFFASLHPAGHNAAQRTRNSYSESKLNQVIDGVFNPVITRARQARQFLSSINITPPKFETPNYNPYLAFMSMTPTNIPELTTVYQSIANVINGSMPLSGQLASLYKTYSGITILNHGYSDYPTPTWDSHNDFEDDDDTAERFKYNDTFRAFMSEPLSEHADRILFKRDTRSITWRTDITLLGSIVRDIPEPPITAPTPTTVNITVTFRPMTAETSLYNLRRIESTAPASVPITFVVPEESGPATPGDTDNLIPRPNTIRRYDPERDDAPDVKVLQFDEANELTAYEATHFGMVIFADELTAAIVPHPCPTTRVEEDNSQFLGSAIQFRTSYPTVFFRTATPVQSFVTSRPAITAQTQPAFSLFRSLSVTIPTITQRIAHTGYNRITFGFHRMAAATPIPQLVQSVLSYTVRSRPARRHDDTVHEPPRTPYYHLFVWSPYVYVTPNTSLDWDSHSMQQAMLDRHWITNLRTIYGTDTTFVEVRSSVRCVPIA
jgi:hypothetical protein